MMSYWEKRQEEAYKAGEMQVNQYFMRLEKAFNQAKRELQKTVESFYWEYAQENSLTYAEAQKRLDKEEIVEIARRIGTFETSIEPFEDCCTVFTPRHPRTRPVLSKVLDQEARLDFPALVSEALAGMHRVILRPDQEIVF